MKAEEVISEVLKECDSEGNSVEQRERLKPVTKFLELFYRDTASIQTRLNEYVFSMR